MGSRTLVFAAVAVALGIVAWFALDAGAPSGRESTDVVREQPAAAGRRSVSELSGDSSKEPEPAVDAERESAPSTAEVAMPKSAPSEATSPIATPVDEDDPYVSVRVMRSATEPYADVPLVVDFALGEVDERPAADFTRSDVDGFARFAMNELWHDARLQGVVIAVHSRDDGRDVSSPAPETRGGAQAWVACGVLPRGVKTDLGPVILQEPRERFPAPLVSGRVLGEDNVVLDSIKASLGPGTMSELVWPHRGGTQVVLQPDGRFEGFGPPELTTVRLEFEAPDHAGYDADDLDPPALGLDIVLPRIRRLTGKLLVPNDMEPDSFYVWMKREGEGFGVSVSPDGEFEAVGTGESVQVTVTRPVFGFELWSEDFAAPVVAGGDLGVIDLRNELRVFSLRCLDASGRILANAQVTGQLDAGKACRFETDVEGRVEFVVPNSASEIALGRRGSSDAVVFDLSSVPAELRLP